MREIEVKANIKDLSAIKTRLMEMGCIFSQPLTQKDRIYLPVGITYDTLAPGTNVLRIREQNGKLLFTLKINVSNELDCIEREFGFDNEQQMREVLGYLGYYEAVKVNKIRIKTTYQDMEICLDEVEGLGAFIEAEQMSEESAEKVQKNLFAFLKTLGVTEQDQELKGYDTLMYQKNKK